LSLFLAKRAKRTLFPALQDTNKELSFTPFYFAKIMKIFGDLDRGSKIAGMAKLKIYKTFDFQTFCSRHNLQIQSILFGHNGYYR